jgi:hypothetical protein
MKLDCIVTMASSAVRLRFLALERSLRASGCMLPLRVIPYGAERFPLPPNATWWEEPDLLAWLDRWRAHPTMRKYQCLLIGNYQFVDADVCFLRNPEEVLRPLDGFVTSCGHWHNPGEATTDEARAWLAARSTTWQRGVFNTGQFACDRALYPFEHLRQQAESPGFVRTCLQLPFHEQPGLNLLVNASGVRIENLTLPPWNQQSTWAGDYPGAYRGYWRSAAETPYLIHWAGMPMHESRPIHEIFLGHLTAAERAEWAAQVASNQRRRAAQGCGWRARVRRFRRAWRALADH